MATLKVGKDKTHKTITSAVAAAQANDTIEVDAGTYANDYPGVIRVNLAFKAVGGRAVCKSTGAIPNGKGIFVAGGNDKTTYPVISFDGFDFLGAQVTSKNGAGIRYQNGAMTLTNCKFSQCQDGILATPFTPDTGTIRIDRCEFDSCGAGDGQSHNMYIGHIDQFSLTNSYTHDAKVGHLVKTRARNNTITNCRIYDNNGTASYAVDCPDAGTLIISNCQVQQGKAGQNPYFFTYGVGSTSNPGRNVLVTSCTIVNDRASPLLAYNMVADAPFVFTDCAFWGVPNTLAALGKGRVQNNNPTWLTTRPSLPTGVPYTEQATEGLEGNAPLDEPPPEQDQPVEEPDEDDDG